MFANSRNIQINGGHWVHNNNSSIQKTGTTALIDTEICGVVDYRSGLDILRQNIAVGAAYDSGERFDPPKCDPDTRVAIIQKIMAWVNDSQTSSSMLWVRGSAGVGKSSLAQTIAELCSKNGRLAGSFFFRRAAHGRSDGVLLISTLSYQLTSTFPAARSTIKKAVNRDPLVVQLSIEGQMQKLFIEPINIVAKSPIRRYLTHYTRSHPRLVVIDGLDECSDPAVQCEILRVLSNTLQSLRFPFRFLIASRPEVHITRSFNELRPNTSLHEIDLSEDAVQADSDIRIFLVKQFKKIKETHPIQQYFPLIWPTDEKIDELVRRSSCQFIYASVAMRYIGSLMHRPVERLDIILGLCPRPANDLPFAQLDELYMHILSSVEKIDIVLKILGILIIPREKIYGVYSTPKMLEMVLDLQPGGIELHLINLQSVITIISPTEPIRILHASLADFLVDPSRAGPKFYVDIGLSHATLAGVSIRSVTGKHHSTDSDWDQIIAHLKKAALTESLLQDLLDFPFLAIFDTLKSLSTHRYHLPKSVLANYIWGWLTTFLSCFDYQSTHFDCEVSKKIYAQLLLRFDTYLKNQLACFAVDDDAMDLLVFVICSVRGSAPTTRALYPATTDVQEPPSWHSGSIYWDVDQVALHVVLTLSGFMRYSKHRPRIGHSKWWITGPSIGEDILSPLRQFLLDPERSGHYFVDGAKYACTALRCLRQLYDQRAIALYEDQLPILRNTTAILLSKVATTEELVAFLTDKALGNYLLSKLDIRQYHLEHEIQDYIKRAKDSPA